MSDERESETRRRRPERIGDLLPEAARALGLEDELALARAMSAWEALVSSRVPAAAGECSLVALESGVAIVETARPIVAQEIRLRSFELLAALRTSTTGSVREIRVVVRHR